MGKGKNHKGGRKQFTNFEEIEKEKEREEKAKAWRARKGDTGDESEEDSKSEDESSEQSSSEEEGEEEEKPKAGVQSLIEVNNPNRVVKKVSKNIDLATVADAATVQLSRREREEISKQQAKEHYAKMTAEGKTEQARADLARLAIIKQQREETARKKEEERLAKEAAKAQAAAGKFAGVKSVSANVTAPSSSTKTKGKRK